MHTYTLVGLNQIEQYDDPHLHHQLTKCAGACVWEAFVKGDAGCSAVIDLTYATHRPTSAPPTSPQGLQVLADGKGYKADGKQV